MEFTDKHKLYINKDKSIMQEEHKELVEGKCEDGMEAISEGLRSESSDMENEL